MEPVVEDNVFYCKHCHSLRILVNSDVADDDWDGAYCGKCGSTDIGECSIDEWLAEENRRKEVKRQIEWNR